MGMTDLNLDAIEARANAAMLSPTGQQYDAGVVLSTDVPALVAEVRSLRTMRDAAWQHYDEQVAAKERAALEERDEALRHLTHAAAVEAALTSDLLAAHVEVERLRVTRATDRNRLRHKRKALAKTRLLLEIRAEQTERLLTDIARVRALCARALNGWEEADTLLCEAEEGRWSAPGIEQVRDELAALDVRHDPSATTEPPQVGARIRIVADGVVTAYDSGSDAVQLDHQECWWPYSGNGVSYSTTEEAS